jgi:hypothetical protein
VKEIAQHLLMSECETIARDLARHVGEQVHAVLKRNGMLMRTVAGATGMGVLASIEVLSGTVEFCQRSMDTDEERARVLAGIAQLFVAELPPEIRGAILIACTTTEAMG